MQERWPARLRCAADRDCACKAGRLFHETLTRRQFMTERSCGRFDRERRRRIKTERHGASASTSRKIASTREVSLASTSARTTVSFGRIVFVNLAKLAESTCSRSNWTRIQPVIAPPNANAASGRATPAGRLSPNVPQRPKDKCAKNDAKN